MSKIFSKTIITLVLALTIFGGFGTFPTEIYADVDCSSITNSITKSNCEFYNSRTEDNPASITIPSGSNGEEITYFPDGRTVEWKLLKKGTFGSGNLYTAITRYPDGRKMLINQETGKITYQDPNGNIISGQSDGLNSDGGWLSFAKTWGGNMASLINDAVAKGALIVYSILTQIILIPTLSMFFRISAALLDFATKSTLSGDLLRGDGIALGIKNTWMIIRDVFNITFIFILLYTAIKTILGSAGTDTKKMIANVITAAILINFSLFITRIVIDAGNILGASIYNMIGVTDEVGLGAKLMTELGISGLWKTVDGSNMSIFSPAFAIISSLQVITLLISFVIFMYVALLMVIRTVMLIFLMALSPIGFMGDVLPKIQEYSKLWRETLYNQAMIAPIFLLFVYLILQISNSFNNATFGLDSDTSQYSTYFKYIMVIILLLAAVKTTKKMSGEMGKIAEKFGGMAVGAALGMATGGVALLGRQTIGRGMNAVANGDNWLSNKLKDSKEKGGLGGFASRMTLKGADYGSKAKFDARNTSTFKTTMKEVSGRTGLSFDTGKAGGQYGKGSGFAGWKDKKEQDIIEEAKRRDKRSQEYLSDPSNKAYVDEINSQINSTAEREAQHSSDSQTELQRNLGRKEYQNKIDELEQRKNSGVLNMSEKEKREIERDLAKSKQEKDKFEAEILASEKKKAEAQITENDQDAKYALDRANAKKRYAQQVRKQVATFRTSGESDKIATKIEGDDVKYDQNKEKADKESKNILDLIQKTIKEAKDK